MAPKKIHKPKVKQKLERKNKLKILIILHEQSLILAHMIKIILKSFNLCLMNLKIP